jgi:hypothetical protein
MGRDVTDPWTYVRCEHSFVPPGGIASDRGRVVCYERGMDGSDAIGADPGADADPDLALISALVVSRDALRAANEFAAADAVRSRLQAMGVFCDDRQRTWRFQNAGAQADAEAKTGPAYDDAWHARCSTLQYASLEAYLACSVAWPHVPRLQTYRELLGKRAVERHRMAAQLGERLGEAVKAVERRLAVLCVEKPLLEGFACGFERTSDGSPFVLLAVNGGDGPVTAEIQARLCTLPGLRACYAHNLHAVDDGHLRAMMRPLPLGACPIGGQGSPPTAVGDGALRRVRDKASEWASRDARLLVAPMRAHNSRARAAYLGVLARPEFAHLVRIAHGPRLPLEDFLSLLAEHRCTLSPPGRGFDCFRTWQALAVGTVPLVVDDPAFDDRLLRLGPKAIVPANELTPPRLQALLETLEPPDTCAVELAHWRQLWEADLC